MNNKKKLTITSRGIIIFILVLLVFILHFINKPLLANKSTTQSYASKDVELNLLKYNEISIEQLDKTTFMFTNNYKESDTLTYAWYIIDKADNMAVFKGEYSSDNQFTYTFSGDGTYVVRAYVKNSTDRSSLDVAEIIYSNDSCKLNLFGDSQVGESETTNSNNSYGLTKEQFNCNFSLPNDKSILEIAEGLKNGTLTVQENLETTEYDIENIDWDIKFSESPNTFQLYFQALNPVLYLTKAYEISEDVTYLDLAGKILKSWDKYQNKLSSKKNSFLWYDHGTALRADNVTDSLSCH